MNCKYGYNDCVYANERCHLCFIKGQKYKSNKQELKPKKAKATKRKGSQYEANNTNRNNQILLEASIPTPNSGAGAIKGDEQIKGYMRITEELKERNAKTSRGAKTFTIHKEWLTKLHKESVAANQEFWYLKFVFGSEDVSICDDYVIIESDMLMSMVKTMWEDRKTANTAQDRIDIAERRAEYIEAEKNMLLAQIAYLEAELKSRH